MLNLDETLETTWRQFISKKFGLKKTFYDGLVLCQPRKFEKKNIKKNAHEGRFKTLQKVEETSSFI